MISQLSQRNYVFNTSRPAGIFAATLLLSVAACVANADDSLIAYYPMDGNFNDASGKGHHLKPRCDTPTFSDDEQIKAGANQVYGPTSEESKPFGAESGPVRINTTKGVTLCGFFMQSGDNNFNGTLFGFGSSKWNDPGLLVEIPYGMVSVNADDKMMKQHKRVKQGFWHHAALVVPGETRSSATAQYQLYVDGKPVLNGPVKYSTAFKKFAIGTLNGQQTDGFCIDEVKVFNRALTEAEIIEEATLRGKVRTEPKKLVLDFSGRHVPSDPGAFDRKGDLRIHFLTKDWLCVSGDYTRFLQERFKEECGKFLLELDENPDSIAAWSYAFHYNFALHELLAHYRPETVRNYQDRTCFTLTENAKPIRIAEHGWWSSAIGLLRVPVIKTGKLRQTQAAAVGHFAYLKPAKSLKNGSSYQIKTRAGESIRFDYDEKKHVSWAIKVNQVGYMPNAGRKYAYLGAWLGTGGTLDFSEWEGKTFYLIDQKTGATEYSGVIGFRMKDPPVKEVPLNGEDIYDMDFSSFRKEGEYAIYVPGIGRSWPFKVSNDAMGESFYIQARGLYHKRCGIAKAKPYTNWTFDECHKSNTYVGGHPPDAHYRKPDKPRDWGMFDEDGNNTGQNSFLNIAETGTDTPLPNVWGGWHDAADYDRRPHHFDAVRCLLASYLMFPDKFTDGQLHIPESGNGIPDIIDEAAWGVDVWRRAQNGKGGVGCWLEATSHPKEHNPAIDTQRYYLALPTRGSTMDYAAHASMLALAYRQCGAKKEERLFLDSAIRAYKYAVDPANRVEHVWKHCTNRNERDKTKRKYVDYKYIEPADIPPNRQFKAAWNLFLLTNEKSYRSDFEKHKETFRRHVNDMWWRLIPFYFIEVPLWPDVAPDCTEHFHKAIRKIADGRIELQRDYPYRHAWHPRSHGYFGFMSWGSVHPARWGRFFIVAWRVLDDLKYRDAALLQVDYNNGTNARGRSMTSGLGSVYPIRFLDLPSYSDGIAEFIPGVTPYAFTYGLAINERQNVHGLYLNARADHGFEKMSICLLPDTLTGGKNLTLDETGKMLYKTLPIWRRHCNVEGLCPAQDEYTVWETIAPNAALAGCLMDKGWMPSQSLKSRAPASRIESLPGYMALP